MNHKVGDINIIHRVINSLEKGGIKKLALSMYGEFFHNIDAKGRLSVPSKFRDSLGSTVVIAQGPERCLRMYSVDEWEKFVESIGEQLDTSKPEGRMIYRQLTSQASMCDIDAQGRIIVTPKHREYAGITKEVAVIGNGSKAEIWDRKKYDEMFGAAVFDDETFSNKIAEFGVQL